MTASLNEEGISVYFVLFSALLALTLVLAKYLHDRPRLASLLPEAGMVLIVGVVFGALINVLFIPDNNNQQQQTQSQNNNYDNNANDDDATQAVDQEVAESLLSFSDEVFFLFLLPPIIFNSGYHLRKELFFRHITPIILFAVLGTTISALVIATFLQFVHQMQWMEGREDFHPTFTELLTFGALISATDPVSTLAVFQVKRVDPQLFYLVFGESVLNDAVGLVLFNAFSKFVVPNNGAVEDAIDIGEFIFGFLYDSVCSPILGLAVGIIAAMIFKYVDMRETKLLELCLFVLIMYVPFLVAEMLDLSGIVTILFTGMAARAYVTPNLSRETAENANTLFRLTAHLAETSIFLELGMSVFGMKGSVYGAFIGWCLLACLIGRALNVYPLVYIYNNYLCEQGEHQPLESSTSREDTLNQSNSNPRERAESVEMTNLGESQSQDSATSPPTSPPSSSSAEDFSSQHGREIAHFAGMVRQDLKISMNTAHMLWFSGLRGAVAYACVRSFPDTFHHDDEFTVTTMVIVLVTVFGLGSTTEAALNCLHIEMNVDEDRYMEAWHRVRSEDGLMLQVEEVFRNYALRRETPIAVNTDEDHGSMAAGEASIASGFQHHHPEHEHGSEHGLDHSDSSQQRRVRRKKDSVFDYGNK